MSERARIYVQRPFAPDKDYPLEFQPDELLPALYPHGSHPGDMHVASRTGYIWNRLFLQAILECTEPDCEVSVLATATLSDMQKKPRKEGIASQIASQLVYLLLKRLLAKPFTWHGHNDHEPRPKPIRHQHLLQTKPGD